MRLADFILTEMHAILDAWDAFAAIKDPAARHLDHPALRDHAKEILQAVARDIARAQTPEAEVLKSTGQVPFVMDAPDTAAQTHALLRARSGFDINQMASEYRALRASVLRLWRDASPAADTDLEDAIRFNEAIDQALCESIAFFSAEVDQSRDLFLGMLGHDMRSPLTAIQMTAAYLARLNAGDEVSVAAGRLINSGARMKALVDDLSDFNRTKLGLGISIVRDQIDLAQVFSREIEQMQAAYPDRRVEFKVDGELSGAWDGNRLRQVLSNLIANAMRYGSGDAPVQVVLEEGASDVVVKVRNQGAAIDRATFDSMFDPLRRGDQSAVPGEMEGLGLGLYISREIARAHGGTIRATSDSSGTVFEVRLPR
jgi:signal transduction histidine kinase